MSGGGSEGKLRLGFVVWAVVLGLAVAAVVGAAVFCYDKLKGLAVARATGTSAALQHTQPTLPAMIVAPAPLPSALPVVERPGKDAYGYPRSYVDGPALRSLLAHDRFAELSGYVEEFQREFEADASKELWPIRAAESFASADPELMPKLDAWVSASPASFAPYLCRGVHWLELAYTRRGTRWARETPAENFKAMRAAAAKARVDLERSLQLSPQLVAALRQLIGLATVTSDRGLADSALERAESSCPTCFSIRVQFLGGLEPRWGGSYREMEDFAARAPSSLNARLKLLAGYADAERSHVAREAKKLDEALGFANAACAVGPHWDFLAERAEVLLERNDFEHAALDLNLAISQRPELPTQHLLRARVREKMQEWEGAGRDLIDAMRLDASNEWARWLLPRVVRGLSNDGLAASERRDRTTAIRLLELASELSPFDAEVHARREAAVRGDVTGTPDELSRLEAQASAAPDDFSAHQQLDFALAKQKKYDRVIGMWTEYLARHAQDGPAYFERSGAYYNSGHPTEAFADLGKACDLGVDQACAYQKRLRH
jgi:tetratricopeptide (TPR) repeat protein